MFLESQEISYMCVHKSESQVTALGIKLVWKITRAIESNKLQKTQRNLTNDAP